jgi:hypothetical protein
MIGDVTYDHAPNGLATDDGPGSIGYCPYCRLAIRDSSISGHMLWNCPRYAEYQERVYLESMEREEINDIIENN